MHPIREKTMKQFGSRSVLLVLAAWLLGPTLTFAQLTDLEKRGLKGENVKKTTDFRREAGTGYWGVVILKGDDFLILRYDEPKSKFNGTEIVLFPVDVLKEGGVHKSARGCYSYLWADVKVGDGISVSALIDEADPTRSYCTEIYITRRPGGKLPVPQWPKKHTALAAMTILNDIENGEDVSEADIMKAFPRTNRPPEPGITDSYVLPPASRDKLTANRERIAAEKEKELKATPPKTDEKK
jgi:hypothetical protein